MSRLSKTPITSLIGLPDDMKLTLGDVATVLQIHRSTAYDLVVGGAMPFVRVTSSSVRVEVRDLRAYVDGRRVEARRNPVSFKRKAV